MVTIGGDIIIAFNGTGIMNIDDLSSCLEEYTVPGQTINAEIVRDNATVTLSVVLEERGQTCIWTLGEGQEIHD